MAPVANTRIQLNALGKRENMQIIRDTVADPGPNQVRIAVAASGVSLADITIRHGMYPEGAKLPFTLGYDCVGKIDAVGPGVTRWKPGDRVAAITVRGANTRYLLWSADDLYPVPEGLDDAVAVSLILNYVTAYQSLHRHAKAKAGDRILVQSAAGGVGTALCELGRLAGLTVYGTASAKKHDLVRSLGATPIDYQKENIPARIRELTGDGVDIAIDGIGGESFSTSYATLRRGGLFVGLGYQTQLDRPFWGRVSTFGRLLGMMLKPDGRKAGFYGIMFMKRDHQDWFAEDLAILFRLANEGKLRPIIHARLPLEEAVRAHEMLESGAVTGKLVLV
jgi:NADPH:quinone reductase-like Zn-dependent oxidoreductase